MNNRIQETYVSFEISKLLKEKGFKQQTLCFYFEDGEFRENALKDITGPDYGSEYTVEYSELTNNWNDNYLSEKNGDRCFGCNKSKDYFETYSAPTHALTIEWLRINHGIWAYTYPIHPFNSDEDSDYPKTVWVSKIISTDYRFEERFINSNNGLAINHHHSPEEAESEAILYALKNLI